MKSKSSPSFLSTGKKLIFLLGTLIIFLIVTLFQLFHQQGLFWDEGVYDGMGKYIFSLGTSGLWEASRPLIVPLYLGFLWSMGLDELLIGKLLSIAASMLALVMVYALGRRIFSGNADLLSVIFVAFSPVFLFHSTAVLTDILSVTFALASVFQLLKNRPMVAGFLLGLSFNTRFLQIILAIPIIAFILLFLRKGWKRMLSRFAIGLSFTIIPFFLLNAALYRNPIYPLLLQAVMAQSTGWVYHAPASFYAGQIFQQSPLLFLAPLSLIFIFLGKGLASTGGIGVSKCVFKARSVFSAKDLSKLRGIFYLKNIFKAENGLMFKASSKSKRSLKSNPPINAQVLFPGKREKEIFLIILIAAAYLLFFSIIPHKESRFVISFLPYVALLAAFSITETYSILRRCIKSWGRRYLIILLAGSLFFIPFLADYSLPRHLEMADMQHAAQSTPLEKGIWITNPLFLIGTSKRADMLLYYPLYNSKKIQAANLQLGDASMILWRSCDILPCPPSDRKCGSESEKFIAEAKKQMETVFEKDDNGCERLVLVRKQR